MTNNEEDDPNVWKVGQLEEFLYFCCPNCDAKEKSKELFVKHALGKMHALKKYDQFALNTSCFWGSTGKVVQFHEIFVKK